jgi:hypothetical protein
MSHFKKSKSYLLNSLMETIYWQQRAFHDYQQWERDNFNQITEVQDSLDLHIETIEKQLELSQKREAILKNCLNFISKTDSSDSAPDVLWLSNWRNSRKEMADKALKEVEEVR